MRYAITIPILSSIVLGAIGCSMSSMNKPKSDVNNPQTLLQQDQQKIAQAETQYKSAVLEHGQSSDPAKVALDQLAMARNQYSVDVQRVRQVQNVQFSSSTTTGVTNQPTAPVPTPAPTQ